METVHSLSCYGAWGLVSVRYMTWHTHTHSLASVQSLRCWVEGIFPQFFHVVTSLFTILVDCVCWKHSWSMMFSNVTDLLLGAMTHFPVERTPRLVHRRRPSVRRAEPTPGEPWSRGNRGNRYYNITPFIDEQVSDYVYIHIAYWATPWCFDQRHTTSGLKSVLMSTWRRHCPLAPGAVDN